MRCEEQKELLDLYMDGELPSELTVRVERHLLRCHSCASELQMLQQTRKMLCEAIDPSETSPGFRERTLARLLDNLFPATQSTPVAVPQWALPFREGE